MKSIEAYKRFLLKINKFDSNDDIRISKGEFVILFNDEAKRWQNQKLKENNSTSEINDLEVLLVNDFELIKVNEKQNYANFELPSNFFKITDCSVFAKTDNCAVKKLHCINLKPKFKSSRLNDAMSSPSFEWEETFYIVSNDLLQAYTDGNFKIDKVFLDYYKLIPEIDIEGYINILGEASTTIDPIINGTSINEVINRCVVECLRNYQNPELFQQSLQRIQTES